MIPTLQMGQAGRRIVGASGGGVAPGIVAALLHFDGANGATTTTDATGKTVTMSGAAKLGTAQSVFGGASLDNTGGAGRVEIATSTDFDFGTGAFLIEWREYRTSNTGFQNSFSRGYNIAGGLFFQSSSSSSSLRTLYFMDSGGTARDITGSIAFVSLNTWAAWAIQRDATGVVRVFRDGSQVASAGPNTNTQISLGLTAPFVIGADNASSFYHRGYIDEFRVQKGVSPYTAAGYTPAASAFTYP
jgi:hypothetical protein